MTSFRRFFYITAGLCAMFSATGACIPANAGLNDAPASRRLLIGAVAKGENLRANVDGGEYRRTLADNFSLIGCENDLKMYIWNGWKGDPMTGAPVIDFTNADAVAKFARDHKQRMRGHCLVYHSVVPYFLCPSGDNSTSPYTDSQIQHMVQEYMLVVISRYKDVIDYWDVTNECFDGKDQPSATWFDWSTHITKNDFWYQHLGGADYFYNIFSWAHSADSHALLYYNDFGAEFPGAKFDGMLAYLKKARAHGCPIDGIGFQCHENTDYPNNVLNVENTRRVDEAGLKWQVTEMDVQIPHATPDPSQLKLQNTMFNAVAKICTLDRNCVGLMYWGFTDKYSWLNPANGLIFDTAYKPKGGYYAIRSGLSVVHD